MTNQLVTPAPISHQALIKNGEQDIQNALTIILESERKKINIQAINISSIY